MQFITAQIISRHLDNAIIECQRGIESCGDLPEDYCNEAKIFFSKTKNDYGQAIKDISKKKQELFEEFK